MFGEPYSLSSKANLLLLIRIYVIKNYRTKKARYAYNGSPCIKGSVTLGNTCTTSLE